MTRHHVVNNRLRWKCRRGMLELGILLHAFLEKGVYQLDSDGLLRFEQLLEYEDNPLFELLMGHMQPADPAYTGLINLIRASAADPQGTLR